MSILVNFYTYASHLLVHTVERNCQFSACMPVPSFIFFIHRDLTTMQKLMHAFACRLSLASEACSVSQQVRSPGQLMAVGNRTQRLMEVGAFIYPVASLSPTWHGITSEHVVPHRADQYDKAPAAHRDNLLYNRLSICFLPFSVSVSHFFIGISWNPWQNQLLEAAKLRHKILFVSQLFQVLAALGVPDLCFYIKFSPPFESTQGLFCCPVCKC